MSRELYAVYLKEQYTVYAESEEDAIDKVVAGDGNTTDYFEVIGVSELVYPDLESSDSPTAVASRGSPGTEGADRLVESEDPGF